MMLRFDDIPEPHCAVENQFAGLVDAYAAMTTARAGRKALTSDEAVWAIWRAEGERCAPDVLDAFIELVGSRRNQNVGGAHS